MAIHPDIFYWLAALVFGLVAGMRSILAPALLAITLSRRPELAPPVAPAAWFVPRLLAVVLSLLALGELVGDKLPMTPNRTALAPFVARVISGALCGAVIAQMGHVTGWSGAAFGAIGAVLGTFGMFHARRTVGRITKIRDPYVGGLEDIVAIAIGSGVLAMLVS